MSGDTATREKERVKERHTDTHTNSETGTDKGKECERGKAQTRINNR